MGRCFISTMILLSCIPILLHAEWIDYGGIRGSLPEVRLISDGPTEIEVEIELMGFDLGDTIINGRTYSIVTLPGHTATMERGYPVLPRLASSIIIPDLSLMNFEIVDEVIEELTVFPVIPSRGSIRMSDNPDTVAFVRSELYSNGGDYPDQTVSLGRPYILKDFRGITINWFPFIHNPRTGELRVNRLTRVRVFADGSDSVNVKMLPRSGFADPNWIGIYRQHFLNYPGQDERNVLERDNGKMLLIAGDGYEGSSILGEFIEWKTRRGYTVLDHYAQDLCGFNDESLLTFVENKYVEEGGLSYLLLIGDGALNNNYDPFYLPFPIDTEWLIYPADNRNGMLEGDDLIPDILISRITARDLTSLQRQLDRIIDYERTPVSVSPGEFYTYGVGIADYIEGTDPGYQDWDYFKANWIWADEFRQYMLSGTWTTIDQLYWEDENDPCPVSALDIASVVNDGRSWLNFIGHGSRDRWCFGDSFTTIFSVDDVTLLNNQNSLPFVWSTSCNVGRFYDPGGELCLAEAWMEAGSVGNHSGSVGFFGAACALPRAPALWAHQHAMYIVPELSDLSANITSGGAICFSSISEMVAVFHDYIWELDGPSSWTWMDYVATTQGWTVFGDCSMQIRTENPQNLTVSHPTHVGWYRRGIGQDVNVPVQISDIGSDEMVSLTITRGTGFDSELICKHTCVGPGTKYPDVPAGTNETLSITVTGFNKRPYEGTFEFIERYRGEHSGTELVHGEFLIDGDVVVPVDSQLSLEKFLSGGLSHFYVDNELAGSHQNYGNESSLCEFVIRLNSEFYTDVDWFGYVPELEGHWGGFVVKPVDAGANLAFNGSDIVRCSNGFSIESSSTLQLIDCNIAYCSNCGLKWSGGLADVSISGGSFQESECGIRIEGCSPGSDVQVQNGCQFSNCYKGIEVVGSAELEVEDCSFVSMDPGLDFGVVFGEGSSGSVIDCYFMCNQGAYHGVDCRSGNSLVTLQGNQFYGPGYSNCMASVNNRAIYALGTYQNAPRIRSNQIVNFWYAVCSMNNSLANLGHHPDDRGYNNFGTGSADANCCDVQFGGRTSSPPADLYAQGNCWNGDPNATNGTICGNWSSSVISNPGFCAAGDGAPPLLPFDLRLSVAGPNPFSDVVSIKLDLPLEYSTQPVTVEIVDLAGRKIRDFYAGHPDPGILELIWDGNNYDGAAVSSGIYVCRAIVANQCLSDKIVLIRDSEY